MRDVAAVRFDALARHVSRVARYPPRRMPVPIPDYDGSFAAKVEEPFWVE